MTDLPYIRAMLLSVSPGATTWLPAGATSALRGGPTGAGIAGTANVSGISPVSTLGALINTSTSPASWAGNVVLADAITKVHDAVKEGESIVSPLEASGVFPPMVISMVDVGEETGQLPEMLLKVAEVYDDEVDNAVESLTSLLEPIMIVFLAFIVGTIVIALFLPLIKIIEKMNQSSGN